MHEKKMWQLYPGAPELVPYCKFISCYFIFAEEPWGKKDS